MGYYKKNFFCPGDLKDKRVFLRFEGVGAVGRTAPAFLLEGGDAMSAGRYLKYLQEEIHTAIAATIDDGGLPVTCAVDMMDADENSLYFLTAKGKSFYDRLPLLRCRSRRHTPV